MSWEKYRQDKVMIIQLVAYWILVFSKKNYRLIAADLSKLLNANSSAIQQSFFTGKVNATAVYS